MATRSIRRVFGAFAVFCAAASACAQSFNIDLDVGIGDPGIGHGAPSSSFGGAAEQPGFWNRFGFGGIPVSVLGLNGTKTDVMMDASYHGGPSHGGGFAFTGNTGDYALLLNDAADVGTIVQGGHLTYTFTGLLEGTYAIYTYAANRAGIAVDTPVTIPGGVPTTEIVTGPMPGNALVHLVTHSVHLIDIGQTASFEIAFEQPPGMHTSMNVNGFQIRLVPEPNSTIALILGVTYALLRARRTGGVTVGNPSGCQMLS